MAIPADAEPALSQPFRMANSCMDKSCDGPRRSPKRFHQWTVESLSGGLKAKGKKKIGRHNPPPILDWDVRTAPRRDRRISLLHRLQICLRNEAGLSCRLANPYSIFLLIFSCGPCGECTSLARIRNHNEDHFHTKEPSQTSWSTCTASPVTRDLATGRRSFWPQRSLKSRLKTRHHVWLKQKNEAGCAHIFANERLGNTSAETKTSQELD